MPVRVDREGVADLDEAQADASVDVNRADLLRGMLGVGERRAVTLLREPSRRVSEARGFASLLDAYVDLADEGPTTTGLYDELDSREKGSFSHRLGLGIAMLLTQRYTGIPWMMHVGALTATETAKLEPEDASGLDLVGLSRTGQWHTIRSKARSGEVSATVLEDARRQAGRVSAINDREPAARRACVTSLHEEPFRVNYVDALEPEEGEEVRLAIDPSAYITEYYAQFYFLTSLENRRETLPEKAGCGNLPDVVLADLDGTPYSVGLLEPLFAALRPQEDDRPEGQSPLGEAVPSEGGWEPEDPERATRAGVSVGRDGVIVTGPAPSSAP